MGRLCVVKCEKARDNWVVSCVCSSFVRMEVKYEREGRFTANEKFNYDLCVHTVNKKKVKSNKKRYENTGLLATCTFILCTKEAKGGESKGNENYNNGFYVLRKEKA